MKNTINLDKPFKDFTSEEFAYMLITALQDGYASDKIDIVKTIKAKINSFVRNQISDIIRNSIAPDQDQDLILYQCLKYHEENNYDRL